MSGSKKNTKANTAKPVYAGKDEAERRAGIIRDDDLIQANAIAEINRYKGISVIPQADIQGKELDNQQQIAKLMTRFDYVPNDRLEHFRYLTERFGQVITGWDARILNTVPAPEGLVVSVEVRPRFADGGFAASASVQERYLVASGRLNYLDLAVLNYPKVFTQN